MVTYTGWMRSIDPNLRWIEDTCFSCSPLWEYAWRFSSHLWSLRVLLVHFVLSWTSSGSSADIRLMPFLISRRAPTLRCRSMMIDDDHQLG